MKPENMEVEEMPPLVESSWKESDSLARARIFVFRTESVCVVVRERERVIGVASGIVLSGDGPPLKSSKEKKTPKKMKAQQKKKFLGLLVSLSTIDRF